MTLKCRRRAWLLSTWSSVAFNRNIIASIMWSEIAPKLQYVVITVIVCIIIDVQGSIDHSSSQSRNGLNDASYFNFNCKDKPRISRFPDVKDCTKFIYCVSGTPHSAKCWPEGARFNYKTSRCDLPATERCGSGSSSIVPVPIMATPQVTELIRPPNSSPVIAQSNGLQSKPSHLSEHPTTTSTSTIATTTSTTTFKPPRLTDMFSFLLDCGGAHTCGLYPNHEGNCSTFLLCSESRLRILKHCHGGQHFDTVTQECRPPEEAHCWKEPDSGPFIRMRIPAPAFCPAHNFNSSLGANKIILTTPMVTNWGNWQIWESCPNGSYISGINAWRRLVQVGSKSDHAGLISIGVQCRTAEGVVTKTLESVAPGAPNDGFGFGSFYNCFGGAAIGFNANIQPDQGPGGDNIATDNVQLICSCGPAAYKPYESIPGPQTGHRGLWSEIQSCGSREALCGFQTQMATYKEGAVGQYDNTGLNNIKMRCCPVPDPIPTCIPSDRLVPVRNCINNQGIYPRRCDFQYTVGTMYNYDSPSHVNSINFYQSVGYSLSNEETDKIRKQFQQAATNDSQALNEYSWNKPDDVLWTLDSGQLNWMDKALYVAVNSSVEIFQVIGSCGQYIVRTNRFVRVNTYLGSGNKTRQYFEI